MKNINDMVKELCEIQPMNINFKALRDDPYINILLSNFAARNMKEEIPFPYKEKKDNRNVT